MPASQSQPLLLRLLRAARASSVAATRPVVVDVAALDVVAVLAAVDVVHARLRVRRVLSTARRPLRQPPTAVTLKHQVKLLH